MPTPHERSTRARAGRHPQLLALALAALATLVSAALMLAPSASATIHRRHHARTASGCAGANAHVGQTDPKLLRAAVVCLINEQRALHHLPPLYASPLLNRSAQGWTNSMVSSDQFTHGSNFAGRISAVGYDWRSAGENIATGFATPASVVRAWMASTGHCENILNPTYRNVGTGISPRKVNGFATGGGTWTQDFALGMHQPTPSNNFGPAGRCPY